MQPQLIYSWSQGLAAAAKLLAKLLAGPWGAGSGIRKPEESTVPRVGWRERLCVCMCACVPLGFPPLHVEVAENTLAGFSPCQNASIIRTTVCPSLVEMALAYTCFLA